MEKGREFCSNSDGEGGSVHRSWIGRADFPQAVEHFWLRDRDGGVVRLEV